MCSRIIFSGTISLQQGQNHSLIGSIRVSLRARRRDHQIREIINTPTPRTAQMRSVVISLVAHLHATKMKMKTYRHYYKEREKKQNADHDLAVCKSIYYEGPSARISGHDTAITRK
jgi:hypothetical protein